jgi:hypothetical protein
MGYMALVPMEVKRLSKVEMKTFTCQKCDWTMKTPFGEEDIAEHSKLHNAKYHSDVALRARISKQELIRLQK